MAYAENRGVRIYYETAGSGPPLVLHHWSLATLADWRVLGYVQAFADDYRVICMDARGNGRSDHPQVPGAYSLEQRVGDVVAVLDDLGIRKADFFGYSLGGWIGFGIGRYAQDRFRSLIIGGQHAFAQSMEEMRELARFGIDHGPIAFADMCEADFGILSAEEKEQMLAQDFSALLASAQDRADLSDALPKISLPCLLFAGEKDPVHTLARECASRIPRGSFVSLPGLDHLGAIVNRDLVVSIVRSFLAGVEGH